MKEIKFQVSTGHIKTSNIVKVIVYNSKKELKKHNEFGDWAVGITEKMTKNHVERYLDPYKHIITIRLVKDKCPPEVVCHEVAHAACFLFTAERYVLTNNDDIESEERFCYIMGDLFAKINRKLHDYGVWE